MCCWCTTASASQGQNCPVTTLSLSRRYLCCASAGLSARTTQPIMSCRFILQLSTLHLDDFFHLFSYTLIYLFNLLILLILSHIAVFFFILHAWSVDYLLKWGADNYTRIICLYNPTIKTIFMSSNNKIPEYADMKARKTSVKHTPIKNIHFPHTIRQKKTTTSTNTKLQSTRH